MNLSNVFTDKCEVILYKGEWIYPIFKCGWAGFQLAKEESRYNEDISELENIKIFIQFMMTATLVVGLWLQILLFRLTAQPLWRHFY